MEVAGGARAAATQVQILLKGVGGYSWRSMELRWVTRRSSSGKSSSPSATELGNLKSTPTPPIMIPVYVSTELRDINNQELRELFRHCNHSCHRFPKVDPEDGRVAEVRDLHKLRIALSHSSVLVSIFCKPHHIQLLGALNSESDANSSYSAEDTSSSSLSSSSSDRIKQIKEVSPLRELLRTVVPVSPSNGQLVGFGRAVSDDGLTASIYDVMVIPPLRRMGIGKLIVKRILRRLTSRDIYDIAALCSEHERLFFKACGFEDDMLGSIAMIYSRSVTTSLEGDQSVKRAGQKTPVGSTS